MHDSSEQKFLLRCLSLCCFITNNSHVHLLICKDQEVSFQLDLYATYNVKGLAEISYLLNAFCIGLYDDMNVNSFSCKDHGKNQRAQSLLLPGKPTCFDVFFTGCVYSLQMKTTGAFVFDFGGYWLLSICMVDFSRFLTNLEGLNPMRFFYIYFVVGRNKDVFFYFTYFTHHVRLSLVILMKSFPISFRISTRCNCNENDNNTCVRL